MDGDSSGQAIPDEETQKLFQQFKSIFGTDADLNLYYALNAPVEDEEEEGGDDDVAHVRFEQMMAELNELATNSSNSTSKTVTTNLSPISSDEIEPIFEEIIVTPSTSSSSSSSSSMYGVRTPTPPFQGLIIRANSLQQQQQQQEYYPHSQLETDDDDGGITITEIVEVHRIPSMALYSIGDNNNPSPITTTPTVTTAPTTTTITTTDSNDDEADIESNVNNNNTSCSLSSTLTDSKTLDVRTPIVV